ncbi:hypothetical protein BKH31_02800 [Actinomyces oris]|uniref:Excisionase n=1 Tax=Actinomyces oris TaxID=544580 RepID=A0A1Q8VJA8_9ACTO|nr:DUF2637 domain-containing protein [Actinomyces oris]OLO48174.1 hypothetical protein BKH31_02800 [Actinomyces oris]
MGRISVAGTALLAIGGFVLSFAALRDLAVRVGMPADLGWIWPLLIDGMIIEATLAVVALAQRGSRAVWYAWFLLAVGAVVSVGSNGVHAMITGHGWAGAAAASVPPVVLLATTHLTVLLMAAPESSAAPARVPAAVVVPELQPEPSPDDGGGASDPVGIHANEELAVEPAETEEPAALLPPAAPDVEPTPAAVEDAAQPPAVVGHVPADDEPEAEVACEEGAEVVEPVVTEEGLGQWVAQQEESGVTVTGSMVADVLGVSASTGRRRLAALRKARQPHLRLAGNE